MSTTNRIKKIPFPISNFEIGIKQVLKTHSHNKQVLLDGQGRFVEVDKNIMKKNVRQSLELSIYKFMQDLTQENVNLDIYSNTFKEKLTLYKKQNQLRKMIESEQIRLSIKSMFLSQIYYLNKNDIESFKKHKNENGHFKLIKVPFSNASLQKYFVFNKNKGIFSNIFSLGRYQQIQCSFDTNITFNENQKNIVTNHIMSFENTLKIS